MGQKKAVVGQSDFVRTHCFIPRMRSFPAKKNNIRDIEWCGVISLYLVCHFFYPLHLILIKWYGDQLKCSTIQMSNEVLWDSEKTMMIHGRPVLCFFSGQVLHIFFIYLYLFAFIKVALEKTLLFRLCRHWRRSQTYNCSIWAFELLTFQLEMWFQLPWCSWKNGPNKRWPI